MIIHTCSFMKDVLPATGFVKDITHVTRLLLSLSPERAVSGSLHAAQQEVLVVVPPELSTTEVPVC